IFIIGSSNTLVHETTFTPNGSFTQRNAELSFYAQDRWNISKPFLVEYGVRTDWDSIIQDWTVQPRVAGTYTLADNKTKFSGGVGLVTDQTNLTLLTQSIQGQRLDQDFASDGATPLAPPRQTAFVTDTHSLRTPRTVNWSAALERMLPLDIYFKTEYQQKRGENGFTFFNIDPNMGSSGTYLLRSAEKRKYDSLSFSLQKKLTANHELFFS